MFEKMAEQYIMVLQLRQEALLKEDAELFKFAYSLEVDHDKHVAHQYFIDHINTINEYRGDGSPIDIGRFICHFAGRDDLIPLVD